MIFSSISTQNSFTASTTKIPKIHSSKLSQFHIKTIICSSQPQNPNTINRSLETKTHVKNPIIITTKGPVKLRKGKKNWGYEERKGFSQVGSQQMLALCGFGYWLQGFRCFPWLALNFHMAHNLSLDPSTLQLVQNSANLPMVAKPLYGILSDAFYIGGAHRIPYISIGALLQVLSWGPLALIPVAGKTLTTVMACVLLSNLGASITEVATDALVAEYGQLYRMSGLQSYAFMASAAGGILGNFLGGYLLLNTPPETIFLIFSILLSLQLAMSSSTKEQSLGLQQLLEHHRTSIKNQLSDLMLAISEDNISRPLTWVVASIAMVPILSGSIFCYQTQYLNLDASVIGMSRVIGQLMLLSLTVVYNRYLKNIPMRKLIGAVQILYASSLLLDLVLVKQINIKWGIPNETFALCFSGIAETLAQFKILPFSVLLASLCPQGCEGSLTSFFASALCLSSIIGGFLGVGLATRIGITSGDYSSLPLGILIQFIAALLPLGWIRHVPMSHVIVKKERKRGSSKRTRKQRRVGRVVFGSVFVYRRERESEAQG